MEILNNLLLSMMIYAGIDDLFHMSIDEITWIIIHIFVFTINWKTIMILPMYIIIRKIKYIGLADWIIFIAALQLSNDYTMLGIISYIFILANIDIKSKKSPIILPITLATMITM